MVIYKLFNEIYLITIKKRKEVSHHFLLSPYIQPNQTLGHLMPAMKSVFLSIKNGEKF